jgi:predicted TPR repeat methyltransferase
LSDKMVGVDLSPAMIAQAAAKGIYDRLVTANIADCVTAEIEAGGRYQLVLTADVFVYVNDLGPILAGVARLLTPTGLLAFTVETYPGAGIKLLPTLRFAYGEAYLRKAVTKAGLTLLTLSAAAVRTERGVPVQGLVVVAGAAQEIPPGQA